METLTEWLMAYGVGALIVLCAVGGVWLMLRQERRAVAANRPASSAAGQPLEAGQAGESAAADLRPLDLTDPDTRVVLGLRALDIYLRQGGDPDLLMLLPVSASDAEALGSYATRRRRGY